MPSPPTPINDYDEVFTISPLLDPPDVICQITAADLLPALSTSKLSSSSGHEDISVIVLRNEEFEDDILYTINIARPSIQWTGWQSRSFSGTTMLLTQLS